MKRFAPTLHNPSLLSLFTVAARKDVKIGQVGVRAVFLHGDLEGEVS